MSCVHSALHADRGGAATQKDNPKLVLLGCEVHGVHDESAIIVDTGLLRMEGARPPSDPM